MEVYLLAELDILNALLSSYRKKVDPEDSLSIKFIVLPDDKTFFLNVSPGIPLTLISTNPQDSEVTFMCNIGLLNKIYSGEITGLTAIARENMSDDAPLNIQFNPKAPFTKELMNQVYHFIQKFFNPTNPVKIDLDKSHARMIHGAWALPMFYHSGFRSAWYMVEKGQRINNPGDTNPYAQAFVIISGNGYAQIGDCEIPIHGGEAYLIPPETEHMLWTDEDPVVIIYLAWGEGA